MEQTVPLTAGGFGRAICSDRRDEGAGVNECEQPDRIRRRLADALRPSGPERPPQCRHLAEYEKGEQRRRKQDQRRQGSSERAGGLRIRHYREDTRDESAVPYQPVWGQAEPQRGGEETDAGDGRWPPAGARSPSPGLLGERQQANQGQAGAQAAPQERDRRHRRDEQEWRHY